MNYLKNMQKISVLGLFIYGVLVFFALDVEAKSIKKNALNYASDYFGYFLATDILSGSDIKNSLVKTGRDDFKLMGEGEQNQIHQMGFLSLSPNFMMVTISRNVNSGSMISVGVTKIDADIPYSDIKYLAFDSRTDGAGKNKVKTFYMGDSSAKGIPIRHLIQENSQFTDGDYKQITWLFGVNYK
jgi:hypothetical protein